MITEEDKDHGVVIRAAVDHLRKTINNAEMAGLSVELNVHYVCPLGHGKLTRIEVEIERRERV